MRFINALVGSAVIAITSSSVLAQSTAVQWTTASGGNGNWYAIRSPDVSWAAKRQEAEGLGGHLATIRSNAEMQFVLERPEFAANMSAWIGFYRDGGYGAPWRWVTGEPFDFAPWATSQPCPCDGSCNCATEWAGVLIKQTQWGTGFGDGESPPCCGGPNAVFEWSADCNSDGIVDYGQILSGQLIDTNSNGIPDCCESGTACEVNLIQNGGLEGGSYSACNGFNILSAGSTVIPGWTIGPNGIDWIWSLSSGPCCDWAPQGDRTIDLNGSPSQNGGAIRQTIQTQPGKHYKFSMRGLSNACCSEVGGQKIMRLTLGSSSSEHVFVTLGGPSPECDSMNWMRVERTWVATATDSLIELKSLVPNSAGGIIVDDISVIEIDPCPGDISGNGAVDGVDLSVLLGVWGTDGSGGEFDADVTNDGIVNGADLTIILGGWGPCPN